MRLVLTLLTSALALVVGACTSPSATPQKLTVMLDWTPNTNHSGIYVARDKGWYKEKGLDVSIIELALGGVDQSVAAGSADFGISVQESVIPARAQNVPVVSVAAIIQHNASSLMSLAQDNIKTPKDLEGKTYGGFGGPLETALVNQLVKCDGGDPSKVKFVDVGNVDYFVGMEQDRYDFVWVFDAWDGIRAKEIEKKQINTIPFIDNTKCIPDWYTPVIITSEKMLKEQRDTVKKFMEATSRGYDFAISNPDETATILLKAAPELDAALVKSSAKYLSTRYVDKGRAWGQQDEEIWTRFNQFLKDAGLIDRPIDVKAAHTNDFIKR